MPGVLKVMLQIQLLCHLQVVKRKFKMLILEKLIDKIIIETYLEPTIEHHLVKMQYISTNLQLMEQLRKLKPIQAQLLAQEQSIIKVVMLLTIQESNTKTMN